MMVVESALGGNVVEPEGARRVLLYTSQVLLRVQLHILHEVHKLALLSSSHLERTACSIGPL